MPSKTKTTGVMRALLLFSIILQISCKEKPDVWMLGFEKTDINPVLTADSTYSFIDPITQLSVQWQKADVFNPAAIVRNDSIYVLFRAEDNPDAALGRRTSRIGLAVSGDGINFKKYPEPVFFPDSSEHLQWDYPGGVEDPRVVELDDGSYVMLYTSWNHKTARLSAATSTDLFSWKKHGPVFEEAHDGKFLNDWSKSGSVVTTIKDGRLKAVKINDLYWMYWGEDFVNPAFSNNLLDWTPLLDENGDLTKVMETRRFKFDSRLTEPGPPALLTENGIILFYNGKNHDEIFADPTIPRGSYCGGQALFDASDPSRFLRRMDEPFICPDLPHELTGQYKAGTTFIEGLVLYKNSWFLYYGTADSMVGLAIRKI